MKKMENLILDKKAGIQKGTHNFQLEAASGNETVHEVKKHTHHMQKVQSPFFTACNSGGCHGSRSSKKKCIKKKTEKNKGKKNTRKRPIKNQVLLGFIVSEAMFEAASLSFCTQERIW